MKSPKQVFSSTTSSSEYFLSKTHWTFCLWQKPLCLTMDCFRRRILLAVGKKLGSVTHLLDGYSILANHIPSTELPSQSQIYLSSESLSSWSGPVLIQLAKMKDVDKDWTKNCSDKEPYDTLPSHNDWIVWSCRCQDLFSTRGWSRSCACLRNFLLILMWTFNRCWKA